MASNGSYYLHEVCINGVTMKHALKYFVWPLAMGMLVTPQGAKIAFVMLTSWWALLLLDKEN